MIEMGILENEGNIGNMRLYIHVYISLTSTFMFKDSKIKLSFPKTGIVKSIIVHEWEFLDFSENPPGAPNSNYKRGNRTDVWIESYWMKMTSEPDESVIIQLPDVVVDGETIHPEPIHFKKI